MRRERERLGNSNAPQLRPIPQKQLIDNYQQGTRDLIEDLRKNYQEKYSRDKTSKEIYG